MQKSVLAFVRPAAVASPERWGPNRRVSAAGTVQGLPRSDSTKSRHAEIFRRAKGVRGQLDLISRIRSSLSPYQRIPVPSFAEAL